MDSITFQTTVSDEQVIRPPADLRLGVRKDIIYLPHGLIVMSYLRSVRDRTSLASYGFMSFFDRRMPFS